MQTRLQTISANYWHVARRARIVYNGSVWHGHSANQTCEPRRSIQGAYIRRDAEPGINLAARMRPETLGRISALAKYVLAL